MNYDYDKLIDQLFGSLPDPALNLLEGCEDDAQWDQPLRQTCDVIDILARALTPLPPGEAVKQRVMQSINARPKPASIKNTLLKQRLCQFFDLPKAQVNAILAAANDAPKGQWQALDITGIHLLHFTGGPRFASADCGLMYLEPGASFPEHHHLGKERALILQGEILENGNTVWRAGDYLNLPIHSRHSFCNPSEQPAIIAITLERNYE